VILDPDDELDELDGPEMFNLGPCCLCGEEPGLEGNPVRNLWMLPVELPDDEPHGWGCVLCGLSARGASAVICDTCAERAAEWKDDESWRQLTHYCAGEDGRARRPIAELFGRPRWAHDLTKHSEDDIRHSIDDPFDTAQDILLAEDMEAAEYARQLRIAAGLETACRACGCSDSLACPGGCVWAEPDLCSRCALKGSTRAAGGAT